MNDFIISLLLLGAMSSSDGYLPYWMTTNQYGLMPERNGAMSLISAQTQFDDSKTWQYCWGASLGANTYNNPLDPASSPTHIMVDQLYASLRWKVFTLDLGQKHRENDFIGASPALGSLSVTGGHLVESGNARSMPGYLGTLAPVAVPWTGKHLWIYGAFGDYATMDQRYCQGALVHRTRIGFRVTATERLSFDAVLDHYGIWGGTSPDYGKMDINLENYLRMVTGSHAGSSGTISDQVNVIGDQGGSEIFRASYRGDGWKITAQHDIPYSDGSGMGFQNFPDGVNTICFSWNDKDRWVSDILYEHHYTMYQSGPINGELIGEHGEILTPKGTKTTGKDQYFWNGQYRSCWTHFSRIIGDPLILPLGMHDGTWSSALMNLSLDNDRYKAHHFGLGGKLWRRHPYKFMLTYSDNHGSYRKVYVGENPADKPWGTIKETGLHQLSGAFTGLIDFCSIAGTAKNGTATGKGKAATARSAKNGTATAKAASGTTGRSWLDGLSLSYGLYFDKGELYQDSFGATIGVRYTIGR